MSYKDEIEKELKGVSKELCAAFAARSALRVLPLLAAKEKALPFWYWKTSDKAKHFLSVLLAIRYGLVCSMISGIKYDAYAFAADAAANAAAFAAADDANAAAFAADDAAAYAAYAGYAATTGYAAAITAATAATNIDRTIHEYYKAEIQSELHSLRTNPDIHSYLQSALWKQDMPKKLDIIWQRFQQWTKTLDLGFDIWLDWYQERLEGKALDLELLAKQVNIPAEIENQGAQAVNAYLATLSNIKQLQPLNRVRAIFIGNGAAGKTSLIKALHGEPVIEGKEKMTPGIDIREWPVGDTDITAHFWDFGGQVMAHSTHQFFLRERCLYVLVIDARTEINANEQVEYWLEHVKAFGKNAPVMIVGNKFDLTQVNLEMVTLREKYSNIIDFYPLSCSQYKKGVFEIRFEVFKLELIDQLQKVGTHQVYFTEQQFEVMQTLRTRAEHQAFIEQQDFETLCAEHQITDEGEQNRDWLLDLLDKLGVVVHFPQLARLDSFILNPRWLTYGIYTLLYSDQAQASEGVLSEANVMNILGAKKIDDEQGQNLNYSADKCGFIIDAMEEFKLCFRLPADRKKIIIPDLLPSDQPNHGFAKQKPGTLKFEFDFRGFLPRHVMPTFIVSRYDEIKDNVRWQQGVLLHSEQYKCDALVQVDYHNRTLSLWLQGEQVSRYFTVLRDEIISILQRMSDLSYQEWLGLTDDMLLQSGNAQPSRVDLKIPASESARASFKQLLALEAAGQTQYISEAGIYDLNKILQIMPALARQNVINQSNEGKALNKAQSVNIFISYTHKDEEHKDELVITLKGMKRAFPQLDWWEDRQLEAGEWEKQILSKLEQADIVILLISRYFMASEYCFNTEMQEALSKYQQHGHRVIPIIVTHTEGWKTHIGKHLALPKDGKPLDEWDNSDRFWGDVQRGLERELERLLVSRNGD